jgi:hypothetical protein
MRLADAHIAPVSTTASGQDRSCVGDRFRCSVSSVVEGWVRLGYDERLAPGIRVVERLGVVLSLCRARLPSAPCG